MKIIQLLPSITHSDAIGNDVFAIDTLLRRNGYETRIVAENIDKNLPTGKVFPVEKNSHFDEDDILIYHFSIGSKLSEQVKAFGGRLVIRYHNITPPEFFAAYDPGTCQKCVEGLKQLRRLSKTAKFCIPVSDFNKKCLIEAGFTCPIMVCPILIKFADFEKKPKSTILEKYHDDRKNFLFVGRLVPNKRQEDVIRAFTWYKQHINEKSRLFLVGSHPIDQYWHELESYVSLLCGKDVIFTYQVKFDELLSYYHLADIFLCMSDHEGFCVPLIESMISHVPILAKSTSAIPGTLGNSGFLLPDNDPVTAALAAERIMTDNTLKKSIIMAQNERLKEFSEEKTSKAFLDAVETIKAG